jgi:PST family polysaccharide transporter
VGTRLVDLGFTVLLARLLLPEHFGLVAMAAASTAFFRLFVNLGLAAAIVQRPQVDETDLSTAFWANLATGVLLFGLVAASGPLFAAVLRDPRVTPIVVALALRFVIAAGSAIQVSMISRRLDFRTLSLRSIVSTAIGGVVGVGLALAQMGVWSLVAQELARTVASTLLLFRATRWRPRLVFDWGRFRALWRFGGAILGARILSYLIRNADNLLVGRYLGAAALGLYAFGFAVFAAPLNDFVAIVHRVVFAALSRLQDDEARLRRGFLLATEYAAMLTVPVMVGMSVAAPVLVEAVFGSRWTAAAPVISILALAGVVSMAVGLGPSGLQATGRADLHLVGTLLAVLVYVPAFAIGLRWGIVGVAWGYLGATVLLLPVGVRFLVRGTGVSLGALWGALAPTFLASAVMAAAVGGLRLAVGRAELAALPAAVLLVAAGALVYAAGLWTVRREAVVELLRIVRGALPAAGEGPVRETA